MKICIITDDNAGFTQDEVKKLGIGIVPMPVIINGEIYFENKNIDQEQFYLKQNGGSDIITSQPSPGSILQLWDEKLKDFEQIVHIPMSSGLSEECNTAKMLAKDYEGKVFVVDNHRISVTLKDSVYEAINLVKKGANAIGNAISGNTGKNALGTTYWHGGTTLVGEHGPELVELPKGSKVNDARSTSRMGGNITIAKIADSIVVREEADIDKIATAIVNKLKGVEPNLA